MCETNVGAGWTSVWYAELDEVPGLDIIPFVANANNDPVSANGFSRVYDPNWVDTSGGATYDNSVRCVNFKAGIGELVNFQVDNTYPGGAPRTIGFWKNWNLCTGGNQYLTAENNGGPDEGWYILDDLLNNPGYDIGALHLGAGDCEIAVEILSKSDISTGKLMASDAAYNLAAQLLAAKLNLSAGAEYCQAVYDAVDDADALLLSINFDGTGGYLRPNKKELYNYGNQLAYILDQYNQGNLCDGIVIEPPSETPDLPPVVEITSPLDGDPVSGASVAIEVSASDDEGVDTLYTVVKDGENNVVYDFYGNSGTWDSTLVDDGYYTIVATATDTIGQTTSDSIVVLVNNVADVAVEVSSLTHDSYWPNKGSWVATVNIQLDTPVVLTVEFLWSDGTTGSCLTDTSGLCTATLSDISKKVASVDFEVVSTSTSGYILAPNGPITIDRPE